nr:MAG TPA: cytochrome b-c1 complex subunit [Caudoviricetes sp.]
MLSIPLFILNLPFNVKKRRTPLHVLRLFTLFF